MLAPGWEPDDAEHQAAVSYFLTAPRGKKLVLNGVLPTAFYRYGTTRPIFFPSVTRVIPKATELGSKLLMVSSYWDSKALSENSSLGIKHTGELSILKWSPQIACWNVTAWENPCAVSVPDFSTPLLFKGVSLLVLNIFNQGHNAYLLLVLHNDITAHPKLKYNKNRQKIFLAWPVGKKKKHKHSLFFSWTRIRSNSDIPSILPSRLQISYLIKETHPHDNVFLEMWWTIHLQRISFSSLTNPETSSE